MGKRKLKSYRRQDESIHLIISNYRCSIWVTITVYDAPIVVIIDQINVVNPSRPPCKIDTQFCCINWFCKLQLFNRKGTTNGDLKLLIVSKTPSQKSNLTQWILTNNYPCEYLTLWDFSNKESKTGNHFKILAHFLVREWWKGDTHGIC